LVEWEYPKTAILTDSDGRKNASVEYTLVNRVNTPVFCK